MKIKKLNESSLVDKKVNTLGKYGKPMYFTADQLKDAKAKYPEYDFEETTIDKSLPQGQKAYIAKKKVTEDVQHCWFGYYISAMTKEKKYFYMTKDVAGQDPDEASDYMEDSIPEPFTKFVFLGSIANTQAEEQGYKLVESKLMNEASYGGAFDIADDQYFTRDDLNELSDEVLEIVQKSFDNKLDTSSSYIENGNELEVTLIDEDGVEFTSKVKIDMRKIKKPSDLSDRYKTVLANDLINQISEYRKEFIEDANESFNKIKESLEGEYSDKFRALAKEWKYNEDDLLSLINEIIRYCPEEDLKDLWIHNRYNLENDLNENCNENINNYNSSRYSKWTKIGPQLWTKYFKDNNNAEIRAEVHKDSSGKYELVATRNGDYIIFPKYFSNKDSAVSHGEYLLSKKLTESDDEDEDEDNFKRANLMPHI